MGSWGVPDAGRADATAAFADDLARFARRPGAQRLAPIIARLRRPVGVAVRGRPGVGVRTVTAALAADGVISVPALADADVRVLVVVETLKPEERAILVADPTMLIVLNKADLTATGPGGPMTNADRCAAAIAAETGVPTVALSGLLAAVGDGSFDSFDSFDDEVIAALRTLVGTPADLSTVDAFAKCEHPVATVVRARLLDRFDRFGVAHAVAALGRGADPATLPALLRELSNLDAVLAGIRSCVAAAGYLTLRRTMSELRSLAVQLDDVVLAEWLSGDVPAMAVMTAAVEVVQSAGLPVDTGDGPDAHLRRAVWWRRYGAGQVSILHRDCSADIVRGSLRLLHDAAPR